MPVDVSTEEKLRDYLNQSIQRLVKLGENGQMQFKNNSDLARFMQFLLLVSDLACEGEVSYERDHGEVLH